MITISPTRNPQELSAIWKSFEKAQKISLPPHLQNLLQYTGFGCPLSISKLDAFDLGRIEGFARYELWELISADKLIDYYGPVYGKSVEFAKKFRILPGHRVLLLELKSFTSNFILDSPVIKTWKTITLKKEPSNVTQKETKYIRNQIYSSDINSEETRLQTMLNNYFKNHAGKSPLNLSDEFADLLATTTFTQVSVSDSNHKIICPICLEHIGIAFRRGLSGEKQWIIINFVRHVINLHSNDLEVNSAKRMKKEVEEYIEEQIIE